MADKSQPTQAGLYKLLVDGVRDYAIFAIDPEGYILTWNTGARRLKGYAADEIIGRHFSIFYPPEDLAWNKPAFELEEAKRDGAFEDEGWRLRKDGTRFWANVVITALHDSDGTLVGFAKVTRDLSERRAAEQRALDAARRVAQAEEANRAKSEFLASMSHELRTPLNAIGGYTDLLLAGVSGTLQPIQADYLERIRRSQQHLLALINDILNFSRIEAGRLDYDMRSVSMNAVIQNVLIMVEPQAQQRDLELRRAPGEDVCVYADQSKVEQVLLNLLSNAIKFTEAGGRITVETFSGEQIGGVRVTDTGIGIPAEKLASVFEPFVQVGRSLTSAQEGTGLGLAISRDLARAMGGDLTARSEPDVGSAFELTLRKA